MPWYDFHADDGTHSTTCEPMELSGPKDVRRAVLASLPDMARDTMQNGDERIMRVIALDATGETVYEATLTLQGQWGAKK